MLSNDRFRGLEIRGKVDNIVNAQLVKEHVHHATTECVHSFLLGRDVSFHRRVGM